MKVGFALVDEIEHLDSLGNEGEELRVGLGHLEGLAQHLGQEQRLGILHRVGMDILQGEHGAGLDNLLQLAGVAMVDVEFENRERHEERAVHAGFPAVALREEKSHATILTRVEVSHRYLVVVGDNMQNDT